MSTFYFRKTLEYDPTFNNKYDKYDGYTRIALQNVEPKIIPHQTHKLDIPKDISMPVFSSPHKRARQTAKKYFQVKDIEILEDLREIRFDMHTLLSKKEYQSKKSNFVRKRFIEAFISDELEESRDNIKTRLDFVINKLKKLEPANYLVISHSFFLKILECYLVEKDLFKNPMLFKKYFDPKCRTYDFGSGFDAVIDKK